MDSLELCGDDLLLKLDKVNVKYLFNGIDVLSGVLSRTQEKNKQSEKDSLQHHACCTSLPVSRYLGKAGTSLNQVAGYSQQVRPKKESQAIAIPLP